MMIGRRGMLMAGGSLAALHAFGEGPAAAQSLDALATTAAGEDEALWYESSPADQADKVVAAFRRRFPRVRLRHVRLVAGTELSSRIIQESQAGATTADVGTMAINNLLGLAERNLLAEVDWVALGAPPGLVSTPYSVATTATVYVLLYNTRQVSEAEAPRGWDDLLSPRWTGKLGLWINAQPFAHLGKTWGEVRTVEFVERLVAQKPMIYRSTFPMAQAVAAGELDVGVVVYHAALPALRARAPVKLVTADPVPFNTLHTVVLRGTKSPNCARLLGAWFGSSEGARAYEDATDRGIHRDLDTRTAETRRNHTLSEFPPNETSQYISLLEKLNGILRRGGRPVD